MTIWLRINTFFVILHYKQIINYSIRLFKKKKTLNFRSFCSTNTIKYSFSLHVEYAINHSNVKLLDEAKEASYSNIHILMPILLGYTLWKRHRKSYIIILFTSINKNFICRVFFPSSANRTTAERKKNDETVQSN